MDNKEENSKNSASDEEKSENNTENEIQGQSQLLELRVRETSDAQKKFFTEWWEEKEWHEYLYEPQVMDCFQLPILNEYISEWKEDDCHAESVIFSKCDDCLKIINKLNFGLATRVSATEKQKNLWREGIRNIQEIMSEKLDYMSFMLVKDAELYLNPETINMEYGVKDRENGDANITLCLWANLHVTERKRGMGMLGFSFKLPMDIVEDDCVVRLLHTLYCHVFTEKISKTEEVPEVDDSMGPLPEDDVFMDKDVLDTGEAEKEVEEAEIEDKANIEKDEEAKTDEPGHKEEDETENVPTLVQEEGEFPKEEGTTSVPKEKYDEQVVELEDFDVTAFEPELLPALVEPEMSIMDPDEYFIVGGLFSFDLYVVPLLTVRKEDITYFQREVPKFRRIRYKRKIVPPRKFMVNGEFPYLLETFENLRYEKEVKEAIFVQLQLPKKMIYLHKPIPVRLFAEKGGYSKICVHQDKYDESTRQISFKTNQFGIFGVMQKNYENLPYTKWSLKGGDAVVLSLKSRHLEIDILISHLGFKLSRLHPDDYDILRDMDSTFMAADLLTEKLKSFGINIVFGENAEKFADISMKEKELECKVYDSMALLCAQCNFMSYGITTHTHGNEIILMYTVVKEKQTGTAIVRSHQVLDYDEEQRRIAAEKEALEQAEALAASEIDGEGSSPEKEASDDPNITKDEGQETEENEIEPQPGETEKQPVFGDLYHYVLNEMDEGMNSEILATSACLIENVRVLLNHCRPISSM